MLRLMSLQQYFKDLGDAAAAKRFGITERAARSYRTGWRRPKPDLALKIVKASKGKVTMAHIYK